MASNRPPLPPPLTVTSLRHSAPVYRPTITAGDHDPTKDPAYITHLDILVTRVDQAMRELSGVHAEHDLISQDRIKGRNWDARQESLLWIEKLAARRSRALDQAVRELAGFEATGGNPVANANRQWNGQGNGGKVNA